MLTRRATTKSLLSITVLTVFLLAVALTGCGKSKAASIDPADAIINYFTEEYQPEGTYVIFDNENVETDDQTSYIVRYQMSDSEVDKLFEEGGFPEPNIYVMTVTYDKKDGKFFGESGEELDVKVK